MADSGDVPATGPTPAWQGDPDDRRPRELRVHGVGGSPGPRLLGFDLPTSVEVVGEGIGGSVVIARRDDETIEGYDWGDLTSGSGMEALWVFLLPFTVLNVAGWMHPRDPRWGRFVRATIHVLSVLLSATYVVSQAILLVDLVGYQWTRRMFCPNHTATCAQHAVLVQQWLGVAGGLLLLLLAAGALVVIAGRSHARFEGKAPPRALKEAAGADPKAPRHPGDRLDSPTFFWHPEAAKRLLSVHVAALGVAWLAVVVLTLPRMLTATRPFPLHLDYLLIAVNVPAAVAVGLLWLVALVILVRKRHLAPATEGPATGPAAIAGPAIAATLAFAPLVAVYSGTFLVAIKRLSDWPKRPPTAPGLNVGAAIAFVDMWGGVVIGVAVLAGLVALLMLLKPHGQTDDIPERESGPGRPIDGADASWRSAIASKRSAAWLAHRADWAALVTAAGLWATAVVSFLIRALHWWALRKITVPANPTSVLNGIGAYVLALLPLFVFQLVRKAQGSRTFVSTVWDVLTFLPRRFSPLAVRCYAERAVPEFQGRLDYHIRKFGRPVIVSAHSQGTIIAFAAVASLPDDCAPNVALVTYGCPIRSIFGRFFPEYFGEDAVAGLLRTLKNPAPGMSPWRNFYRRTDPIGGPVFLTPSTADRGSDVELADPMPPPAVPWPTLPGEAPLEHDRPVWTQIAVHSYYLNEPELKHWVARLKTAVGSHGGPGGPGAPSPGGGTVVDGAKG